MTNPAPAPAPIPTVPEQLTQEQIDQIAEERVINNHIAMLCADMFALQTRKLQAITTCSNVSFSPSSSPSIATVPVIPSPVTAIMIENPAMTSSQPVSAHNVPSRPSKDKDFETAAAHSYSAVQPMAVHLNPSLSHDVR